MKQLFLLTLILTSMGLSAAADDQTQRAGANVVVRTSERHNLTAVEVESLLRSFGIQPSATPPIHCDIEDALGNITKTVTAANYSNSPAYWIRYVPSSPTQITARVRYTIVPLFTGGPLASQVQMYTPNSAGPVLAPFAIPSWGGNATNGSWVVMVQNDAGQQAQFIFTVQ
jgi:hypothetical protein